MIESLYSNARLYDLMYPQPSGVSTNVGFYLDLAAAARLPVLELACGTGSMLLPIAAHGIECEGVDLSSDMLAEARAKFEAEELSAPFHVGDMASFDLGRRFGLIFIASNSLLHLHSAEDIVRCFQAVSDSWSGMATSRGALSRTSCRIRCASVKRPRGCARHHRRTSAAVDWLRQPLNFIVS